MNVKIPKSDGKPIVCPDQIYEIMQKVLMRENKLGRSQEYFWVVGLNNASKILFIELIGLGQANRVHTDAPTTFRMAIYKLATKVIFVHNHPSGSMTPSEADINMTNHQHKAGQILEIEVMDHVIISETEFFSFDEAGMMESIKKSPLFTIMSKEKQELDKFKNDLEREKAVHNRALEIAKKMKDEGMDIDFIKKVTGLGKVEIRKL